MARGCADENDSEDEVDEVSMGEGEDIYGRKEGREGEGEREGERVCGRERGREGPPNFPRGGTA